MGERKMPKVMIDMEMPCCCAECKLNYYSHWAGTHRCVITQEKCDFKIPEPLIVSGFKRPSWCPLQEVKECK